MYGSNQRALMHGLIRQPSPPESRRIIRYGEVWSEALTHETMDSRGVFKRKKNPRRKLTDEEEYYVPLLFLAYL
jgi:hypothetical protein